jgi:lipopolysaccharide biosynthesis protein
MRKGRTFRVVTTNSTQSIQSRVEPRIVITDHGRGVRLPRATPAQPQSALQPTLNLNVTANDIKTLLFKYKDEYESPCLAIVHLYFTDLIDETILHLKKIPYQCKFVFTLTEGSSFVQEVIDKLNLSFPDCTILPMKNAGKDIGPKLKAIQWLRKTYPASKYKYLLFLHDKKHGDTPAGTNWRRALYSSLCSHRMFTSGFYALEKDPKIKMASATSWVLYGRTRGVMYGGDGGQANKDNLYKVCAALGLAVPTEFGFVGGTMFWCDFDHFNRFWTDERLQVAIRAMDMETGNVREPSFTHAVERVFGMMITLSNHIILKI